MNISPIEGIVENGQIRLLGNVVLPEKAKVYVVIPGVQPAPIARIASPHLAHPEQARDFVKQVIETPVDAEI